MEDEEKVIAPDVLDVLGINALTLPTEEGDRANWVSFQILRKCVPMYGALSRRSAAFPTGS